MERRCCLVAAAVFMFGGCMYMGRRVELSYGLPNNPAKARRQAALAIIPFQDKRNHRYSLGQGSAGVPLLSIPLRAANDVSQWATIAMTRELEADGYKISGDADWKVGGLIDEAACNAHTSACAVHLEIFMRMKDNWQVLKRDYRGEAWRPALLWEEDPYALSLQEALRDALAQFKRDAEMTAP